MRYARQYYREIQLHKMQVFVDFCRHKTLTKTGRALGMTTADVNNVIMSIEKTLGGPVFIRKMDRLVLTEAGEEFLQVSEKVLSAIEDIDLNAIQEKPTKELNIATTVWDAQFIFPDVVKKFKDIHPDVNLNLFVGTEFIDLTNNDCDIAIGGYVAKQPEIKQRLIAELTLKFFATANYLKKNGTPKNVQDIKGHSLIVHTAMPPLPDHIFRNNTFSLTSNSYLPLVDFALNDLGMVVLPSEMLSFDKKAAKELVPVVPEFEAHRFSMFFLSRQKTNKEEFVDTLFDLIKEKYN